MKNPKLTLILVAALGLSACSTRNVVSRGEGAFMGLLTEETSEGPATLPSYTIADVRVIAPATLSVSEANSYFPNADIVWRGDALGNRYEQIATIIDDALTAGVAGMTGSREVILDIEINRFHSLSQRTRYSYGGTHDIDFDMTILDAETGAIIEPKRHIETSLPAFGGQEAVDAEAIGQTQKVRITAYLSQLIRQDLQTARFIPAL